MTCLPGETYQRAPSLEYLSQAGQTLGRLHRLLALLDYAFRFQIPYFHDPAHIAQALFAYAPTAETRADLAFYQTAISGLELPSGLPRQIIHGDPKLSNFLFAKSAQVTGMVDLDTFMVHYRLVELGDALRSWCTVGEHFDRAHFRAGLTGYAATGLLTPLEHKHLLTGVKLITLELGMRYLKDVFEDCYFQWDPLLYPSRPAHNLARARRQTAVYRDILRQEDDLEAVVTAILA